jgi:hypothetical protein
MLNNLKSNKFHTTSLKNITINQNIVKENISLKDSLLSIDNKKRILSDST